MNLNILLGLLIVATAAFVYVFYVRPLLKATPTLGYLYADEERFWRAVAVKFDGLKQRIVTAFLAASGFVVAAYDFLAPYFASAGVDVSKLGIAQKVPADAWPFIGIGVVILLGYLRHLGDKSILTKIADGSPILTVEAPVTLDAPPEVPLQPAAAIPVVAAPPVKK